MGGVERYELVKRELGPLCPRILEAAEEVRRALLDESSELRRAYSALDRAIDVAGGVDELFWAGEEAEAFVPYLPGPDDDVFAAAATAANGAPVTLSVVRHRGGGASVNAYAGGRKPAAYLLCSSAGWKPVALFDEDAFLEAGVDPGEAHRAFARFVRCVAADGVDCIVRRLRIAAEALLFLAAAP